jgi:hypothetical protein
MLMENPHSSMLKKRPFMRNIGHVTVDYCKWWSEGFPHRCRKRTAIYRIGADWEPSRPRCNHDCGFCVGRKHLESIGNDTALLRPVRARDDMYSIPPLLCRDIVRWAAQKFTESL